MGIENWCYMADLRVVDKKSKRKAVRNKDTAVKHAKESVKHVRELKKHVKSLSQQLFHVQQDVAETKIHYQHIPKLSLETQMLIESMNKLSAVVKQLLVLFNQKMSNEEGPLFAKLDEITEQNEKIAEGILAVAELVKEKQTPKAQIREFNPYIQQRQQPLQMREQMPPLQEMPRVPSDLGKFQFPQEQQPEQEALLQNQPQPIPQYTAPLPPFSQTPRQEHLPSRKRMLF